MALFTLSLQVLVAPKGEGGLGVKLSSGTRTEKSKFVSPLVCLLKLCILFSLLMPCGALCWYQSLMRGHASSCFEIKEKDERGMKPWTVKILYNRLSCKNLLSSRDFLFCLVKPRVALAAAVFFQAETNAGHSDRQLLIYTNCFPTHSRSSFCSFQDFT